jgi:hypothetical protein
MKAHQFEAIKIALKQDRTGYVLTLGLHPDEIPEDLLRDFVGSRYGVAMVRINDDETPVFIPNPMVKKAGMLERDKQFWKWLREENSLTVNSSDECVFAMYNILMIQSRAELNHDKEAQERFDSMMLDYENWSDKNDPF